MKATSIREIDLLCERYDQLLPMKEILIKTVELIAEAYRAGHMLLVCGNGGSAADSLHVTGELMKSFAFRRAIPSKIAQTLRNSYPQQADYYIDNLEGALPTTSLVNEVGLMTAYSNDKASDLVFAQQVLGYGKPGAVLLAISTSGNSVNVLHAARVAKAMDMSVVSLTGKGGGALKELSDLLLDVPSTVTYQIQELHLPIYHAICLALEHEFFDEVN